jgi:ATP/maltotriose-dependent transcriptional regulator MalT
LTVQRMARLALRIGEPARIACALSMAGGIAAVRGQRRHATKLLRHAAEAAARTDSEMANAWVAGARQYYAYCCDNDWRAAIELGGKALDHIRATGMGRIHSTDTAQIVRSFARMYHGDLRELAEETAETVQTAARLGNRYVESTLRAALRIRHLARDEPARARADLELAAATLPPVDTAFYSPHWVVLWGRCETALYAGDAAAGHALLAAHERIMAKSLLLYVAPIRCEYRHLEGRLGLAMAANMTSGPARTRLLRRTRALARSLAREPMPMGAWAAALLRAGVANVSGDRDATLRQLRESIDLLERGHTRLFAMAARRRLGTTLRGEEGESMIRSADGWMSGEGCTRPDRMAAMLVPGWASAASE